MVKQSEDRNSNSEPEQINDISSVTQSGIKRTPHFRVEAMLMIEEWKWITEVLL